jgi:hypothetical protein
VTAREKFKIGDHVVMTEEGKTCFGYKNKQSGTLVGFSLGFALVWIRKTRQKAKQRYHMDFWEVDERFKILEGGK